MRTTLSLDDDVAALLARARNARKSGLKPIVNEALRQGLRNLLSPPRRRRPPRTRVFDAGRCLVGSVDNVAEVLALAEGEDYR
jgi:hypothetical protein